MTWKPRKVADDTIDRRIERWRQDAAFQIRLRKLIERNRRVLDRLSR